MMPRKDKFRAGLCVFAVSTLACAAADWPHWRGPHFNGSTEETNLPTRWSPTNNIVWKTPLPGQAASTPVISGDMVFLTSPDENKDLLLLALDRRTGAERWRKKVASGGGNKGRNNDASPSPCTDGRTVVAMFATGDVAAFDVSGRRLWSRNLAGDFGGLAYMWIYGASPLLHGERLYIPMLQCNPVPPSYTHALQGGTNRESFLLCVDPATGKDLWRHVRKTAAVGESQESYTTPIPRPVGTGIEILLFGANHLTAHNPANGREIWRSPDLNPRRVKWWRVVPSPLVTKDVVVVCGPKREPVFGITPGNSRLAGTVAWQEAEPASDCTTPLFYQDRLFVLDGDRQDIARLDPKTGARLWTGNLGVREIFRASPLGADHKVYCLGESGTVVVLAAGDEFKILATNPAFPGEAPVRSSLVAAHGRLFMRTAKHLVCIGTD